MTITSTIMITMDTVSFATNFPSKQANGPSVACPLADAPPHSGLGCRADFLIQRSQASTLHKSHGGIPVACPLADAPPRSGLEVRVDFPIQPNPELTSAARIPRHLSLIFIQSPVSPD